MRHGYCGGRIPCKCAGLMDYLGFHDYLKDDRIEVEGKGRVNDEVLVLGENGFSRC